MKRIKSSSATGVAILVAVASACRPAGGAGQVRPAPGLTKDDVLSIRKGRFYLDGKPFAEISFNKFDLFWQLYNQLAKGHALDDANPMVQAQDKALRHLHEMGFHTIRFFALPWGPRGPESYADAKKRKTLYAALDKALELCDRHNIRVVWSLGASAFTDTKLIPGKGWVYGQEQMRELVANPNSRGRKLLYRYIDETVNRYKDRKAVLMWEITNELTLAADIGRNGVYKGQRMPTLKDVARFYDDVAKRIKADDPLRLVNNGGSHMREHQWHLYWGQGWVRDTFEEQFRCFKLLFANSAVDVIDIHLYPNNKGGYVIMGKDGKKTLLTPRGDMEIAARLGKPLMIGELGLRPAARTEKKVWADTPDYFESYADAAAAKPWVEKTLNSVIDAGVQLAYWWCYQSDRPKDQNKPQRLDISLERNPELLACFVEANKRLRARLASSARPGVPVSKEQVANLWDMTDVRKQPLDVEIVGRRKAPLFLPGAADWMNQGDSWVAKQNGGRASAPSLKPAKDEQLVVEELFLSSERTPDEPNRIFCAVARPEHAAGRIPVILVFHGGGGHASGALAVAIARRHPGMAAVAMDYNGQFRPGPKGKVTQWKNVTREHRLDLVPDLRNWPLYHSVIAARRTIDFIETQPWADKGRIGAVGISYGGWVALILAGVDDRVKCVTTGVSAGGAGLTQGRAAQQLRWAPPDQHLVWLSNYEPLAYAPRTKAAVFFQLATDDLFFWLDGAEKNLEALPGEKGWVLRPNSNHNAGGPDVPATAAPAFMRHVLLGGPPLPEVTEFKVSGDGARYTWRVRGPRPVRRAALYWSPGGAVSPARYWIEFPATRKGDTWTALVPSEFGPLASQAFVNTDDEAGLVVSSTLLRHEGLDPMLRPAPQWPGGQIWDTDRGAAAWRTPAPWFPKTVFEVTDGKTLRVGPAKGGRQFALLTNSVVLASGGASAHKGIAIRVNGNGHAGRLNVTFLRDTNSLDERAYTAEITYTAETSLHELPWSAFKLTTRGAAGPPRLRPFDGLRITGERESGKPITLASVAWIHP